MTDPELQRLLNSAKVPERPDDYWERFPVRVAAGLQRQPSRERADVRRFPRLAWGLSAAAVCLLIGFAIGHWRGRSDASASNSLLQNEKVIREVLAMFPNRVRAIVQDERGLNLVLSERANVPASPPLCIQVTQAGRRSSFLTFSGQEIEIVGQKVTVLSDSQGQVMLVGDRFFWSPDESAGIGGDTQITAKQVGDG